MNPWSHYLNDLDTLDTITFLYSKQIVEEKNNSIKNYKRYTHKKMEKRPPPPALVFGWSTVYPLVGVWNYSLHGLFKNLLWLCWKFLLARSVQILHGKYPFYKSIYPPSS